MTSSINEEEDNFLRFFKLVNGPGTEAVRIFFDSFFPNNTLDIILRREESNIRRNAKSWRLTGKQLDLMFPAVGKVTSKEFDITLLIGLIRNFVRTIGHVVYPTNKDWESLPDPKDIKKGDDLVRIKFLRNEMAHSGDDVLDTASFKSHWKNIKEAISRLSGARLDQRCIQLETMRLDNISEVREEIKSLKADMIEYFNELQIPGRDSHILEIGIWEEDNHTFVKTDAVDAIVHALQIGNCNCVPVIGSFGQGKSSLIQHVALRLRDEEGYVIIPCRNPMEIKLWYEKEKKQIFIVDDVFGERYLMTTKLESWQDYAKFLKSILSLGRTKVIASSALHIFNDANSKCQNNIFKDPIYMNKFPLTKVQKRDLLNMHIQSLEQSEIDSILALSDEDIAEHFPLLCAMYNTYRSTLSLKLGVYYFFCNRRRIHEEFLDSLNKHDEHSYKTILIFVLLNGKVSQIDNFKKEIIGRQEVKLNFLTEYLDIKKDTFYRCLENLTGTYIRKGGAMFLPINNRIFYMLLKFSARVSQQTIIQHLNSDLLFSHAHFTSIDLCVSDILIPVSHVNENLFFQRMLDVMKERQIFKAFNYHGMNNWQFRQKFIQFIKSENSGDNTRIAQILNTKYAAKTDGTLPLLPIQIASNRAWADMVQMLAAYVDVNFYGVVGFSALHAACVHGDIHTVKVLIDNKADVNKTANWGHFIYALDRYIQYQPPSKAKQIIDFSEKAEISPLLIACIFKHKSIVELLLKNGACLPTHIDIVNIETVPEFFRPVIRGMAPGSLLLNLASLNNDIDMFNLLKRYGAKYVVDIKVPSSYHVDIPLD
ncbi:uncharacterized protein [Mytilus edulis]|uniref:uncharacterized protein n=1 Tax=Mytilus edulis TaxID=6550 RepID=UPI0039F02F62